MNLMEEPKCRRQLIELHSKHLKEPMHTKRLFGRELFENQIREPIARQNVAKQSFGRTSEL